MTTATITRDLVAVSANEDTHRQLTTPAAVLANVPSLADAAARDIFVYYWTRDVSKARAWLEAAAKPTEAELARLAPTAMDAAMRDLWRAFGRFWQAMNLSPFAFAPFRAACERAWCPMSEADPRYWRGRVVLVNHDIENNHLQPGVWSGAWRQYAVERFRRYGGGDGDPHDDVPAIGQVVFGAPRDFTPENIGCRPEETGVQLGRCQAPTGETHRVWLQYDGTATGGNLYPAATVNEALDWPDDGRYGVNHYWTADARWYRKPLIGQNVYWYIPSWKTYFDLLRAPQPGLRLTPDGPDVSIVEYLLRRPPYELAREVLLNVVLRNAAMKRKWMLDGGDLASAASRLFDRAETERQADIRQVTTLTHAVGGLVTPFATLGTAGAVAGIIGGALDLVVSSTASLITKNPDKAIDVFGRLMPAFEVAVTTLDYTAFVALMDEIGLPDGYTGPEIRVRALPPWTSVKIDGVEIAYDGASSGPSGQWSDDTQTEYVVRGVPAGPHLVQMALERDRRMMSVDTSNGSVTFDWSSATAPGLLLPAALMVAVSPLQVPARTTSPSPEPLVTAPPPAASPAASPAPPPTQPSSSSVGTIALVAGAAAVGVVLVMALSPRSAPTHPRSAPTHPRRNPSGSAPTRPKLVTAPKPANDTLPWIARRGWRDTLPKPATTPRRNPSDERPQREGVRHLAFDGADERPMTAAERKEFEKMFGTAARAKRPRPPARPSGAKRSQRGGP